MAIKRRIPAALWRLADEQGGVLSHAQATSLGLTRSVLQRALDDRILWRVARGIHSVTPQPSWTGLAWAGVLLGGEDAVLGYDAAAHLHGWGTAPSTIDVLVPRRVKDRGCWRFHNTTAQGRGSLPVTSPEQTAIDICSVSAPQSTLGLLADAVTSRRTTAARLLAEAERRPNLRQRAMITEVLRDVADGIHSHLEERFHTFVERAHGLTGLRRQVRVQPGEFTDILLEDHRLVIELDGRLGHDGRHAFRDHRRDNRNVRAGFRTLRYGWDDIINRPCKVLAEIVVTLRELGWQGAVKRCVRCPA